MSAEKNYNLRIAQVALTVGKRWFWESGLNLNLNLGFGLLQARSLERDFIKKDIYGENCEGRTDLGDQYSSPWLDFGSGFTL